MPYDADGERLGSEPLASPEDSENGSCGEGENPAPEEAETAAEEAPAQVQDTI